MARAREEVDARLRETLSSWHQRRRYRPEARTHHRSHPIRYARQIDLNREFRGPRYTEWQWFLVPLITFTVVHFFYLQR